MYLYRKKNQAFTSYNIFNLITNINLSFTSYISRVQFAEVLVGKLFCYLPVLKMYSDCKILIIKKLSTKVTFDLNDKTALNLSTRTS